MSGAYERVRHELDTGDVVLFSGKGLISAGIKFFTKSPWSHVGMVLRIPEYDIVMLWESTTLSNIKDAESGLAKGGVQLVPLSARIAAYDGEIAIRKLEGVERTPEMRQSLAVLRQNLSGRPYQREKLDLLRAALPEPLGNTSEDLSSLFCSELVGIAYEDMGLLPVHGIAGNLVPADFSADKDLGLTHGTLSEHVNIKS